MDTSDRCDPGRQHRIGPLQRWQTRPIPQCRDPRAQLQEVDGSDRREPPRDRRTFLSSSSCASSSLGSRLLPFPCRRSAAPTVEVDGADPRPGAGPLPPNLLQRARVVLLLADGVPARTVAIKLDVSRPAIAPGAGFCSRPITDLMSLSCSSRLSAGYTDPCGTLKTSPKTQRSPHFLI